VACDGRLQKNEGFYTRFYLPLSILFWASVGKVLSQKKVLQKKGLGDN
jgi:hypothetical protein